VNRMSLGAGVKIYCVLSLIRSMVPSSATPVLFGCRNALSIEMILVKKVVLK
jgi:hypothetical protein